MGARASQIRSAEDSAGSPRSARAAKAASAHFDVLLAAAGMRVAPNIPATTLLHYLDGPYLLRERLTCALAADTAHTGSNNNTSQPAPEPESHHNSEASSARSAVAHPPTALQPLATARITRTAFTCGYTALATGDPRGTAALLFRMLDLAGDGTVHRGELSALLLACGPTTLRRAAALTQTVLPSESPVELLLADVFKCVRSGSRTLTGEDIAAWVSRRPLVVQTLLSCLQLPSPHLVERLAGDGHGTGVTGVTPAGTMRASRTAAAATAATNAGARDDRILEGAPLPSVPGKDRLATGLRHHRSRSFDGGRLVADAAPSSSSPPALRPPSPSGTARVDDDSMSLFCRTAHRRTTTSVSPAPTGRGSRSTRSTHGSSTDTYRRHASPGRRVLSDTLAAPVRFIRSLRRSSTDSVETSSGKLGIATVQTETEQGGTALPPDQAQPVFNLGSLRWSLTPLIGYAADPSGAPPPPPPQPTARFGHTLCALPGQGTLLLVGGCARRILDDVWEYDAQRHAWIKQPHAASMPPASRYHTCVATATHALVFGGYTSFVLGHVWMQTLATGVWECVAPPSKLKHAQAHTQMSGTRKAGKGAGAEADGVRLLWPLARFGHSATLLCGDSDGGMWVFGGMVHQTTRATAELWRYDPRAHTWTAVLQSPAAVGEKWPAARVHHTALALDDHRLLVVGGRAADGHRILDDTWVYDTQTARWEEICMGRRAPPTVHACAVLFPAAPDPAAGVLLLGGQEDGSVSGEVWWLPVHLGEGWRRVRLSWSALTPSAALRGAAAVALGRDVLLFGGQVAGPGGTLDGRLWELGAGDKGSSTSTSSSSGKVTQPTTYSGRRATVILVHDAHDACTGEDGL